MMNKAQADIAYGFTTITRTDPAYYAFWVMNTMFGQYGLGGRLGDNIRERQGMAYYAYSSFDANHGAGPLVVRAGVNPANVERALAAIDEEIAHIVADGLTEQEVADARQYLIGSIPRMLETDAGIASFLQMVEQFDLGLDYDQRLPDLLGAVTREDAHAAARRALATDRASIAVAGPYAAE
jgi:zinc protease